MTFLPALILAFAAATPSAQAEAAPFACTPVFEALRSEVEGNYAGYVIEYRNDGPKGAAYRAMAAESASAATGAPDRAACSRALNGYIAFFSDPHLFLQEAPAAYDEARSAAFRAAAPHSTLSVEALRSAALAASDPVAGVWSTDEGDVAVVPAGEGYDAVIIASRHEAWQVGQVRAHLTRAGEAYDVTLYRTSDRAPVTRYGARLEGDLRLMLAPVTWGRVEPRVAGIGDVFDPRQPRRPVYVDVSPDVGVLYLPSFDPGKVMQAGGEILRQNGAAIAGKKLLVIDIRGNEGGSQSAWEQLAPFYSTGTWEPSDRVLAGSGEVVLAGPRVIGIWERFRDNAGAGAWRDTLVDLVERLKAAPPGTLVPFREDAGVAGAEDANTGQQLAGGPQAVAILADGGVVSAGEAFMLKARRSPKVTLFGQNSAGSIDYWTVGMFVIGSGETRYNVGMPVGAASDALPAGGYNADGVPVDVRLTGPYDSWLPQVLAYYGLR